MEEKEKPQICIQPINAYGIKNDVKGNIHLSAKDELIYPIESVLSFQDFITKKQKFMRFPEKNIFEIITISPDRKLLAICELLELGSKRQRSIGIYDLDTTKKRRTLILPHHAERSFNSISFTKDSRALAGLTMPPDAFLYLFLFDKDNTIFQVRAGNLNQGAIALCFACNPFDAVLFAVGGRQLLRIITKNEQGLSITMNNQTKDMMVKSITWITQDTIAAGTIYGELVFIESGDIKMRLEALTLDVIDILQIPDSQEATEELDVPVSEQELSVVSEHEIEQIKNLTWFNRGFAFSIQNVVYVYEKESRYRFIRKTIITLPIKLYPDHMYDITCMAINTREDTILVTAKHSQVYVGTLFLPEAITIKELEFTTFGECIHIDRIIDVSVCSWKPIIMTASKDLTIRIWNYKSEKIELIKMYQIEITCVALHQTGVLAAVGFTDKLRLMEVFLDNLKTIKTFNCPHCRMAVFSEKGHLLAAAYDKLITILSPFSYEILITLKGHNGIVLSIAWSKCDNFVFSGGIEGAVYQWEVSTGKRINEVVQKGTEYQYLASATHCLYAVTNFGTMKEIIDSEIVREINIPNSPPLQELVLARSELVMFITTKQNHLYNVQMPFLDAGGGVCTNFRFFQGLVTKMKISYDDTMLITASDQGTLVLWLIQNNQEKIAPKDTDLGYGAEVLIPRSMILDKLSTIEFLELRMKQQIDEFQYQIKQIENTNAEHTTVLHKQYGEAIEELKQKNESLGAAHVDELNVITSSIAEMNDAHEKAIRDIENKYEEKIMAEFDKSVAIQRELDEMRIEYEKKLQSSTASLQDAIEALEIDFKEQLLERQELIASLLKDLEEKKAQYVEYSRQVEEANDRQMIEQQVKYENMLKDEIELKIKWQTETGVLNMKCNILSKESEDLREELDELKQKANKHKKTVALYIKEIEDLRKEIEERNITIADKEKRIQDMQNKNEELKKYKQVLNHKIQQLESEIEPRERQIKDQRNKITENQVKTDELNRRVSYLELSLKELKNKYQGLTTSFKFEKQRASNQTTYTYIIVSDIFNLWAHVKDPRKLQEGFTRLYQKYATENKLKRPPTSEAQTQTDYAVMLEKTEKKKTDCLSKTSKSSSNPTKKLLKENMCLLEEVNNLRNQLKDAKTKISNMELTFGIVGQSQGQLNAQMKGKKVVDKSEELKKEIINLQNSVKSLTDKNETLINEISELKKQT